MKKVVLSLVIVFGIVLITGCGKIDFSKKSRIVCNKVEDKTSDVTTQTLTLAYDKNEKISDFKVETNIVYKRDISQNALEIMEKSMKVIGKIPGVGFESKVENNRIYFSFTGSISMFKVVMKQTNKDYNEDKITGDTKSEALTELTKDGYTCEDIKK